MFLPTEVHQISLYFSLILDREERNYKKRLNNKMHLLSVIKM